MAHFKAIKAFYLPVFLVVFRDSFSAPSPRRPSASPGHEPEIQIRPACLKKKELKKKRERNRLPGPVNGLFSFPRRALLPRAAKNPGETAQGDQ